MTFATSFEATARAAAPALGEAGPHAGHALAGAKPAVAPVDVVVAGARGRVARCLLDRLATGAFSHALRLAGAFQRERAVFDPAGLAPRALPELLEAGVAQPWQASVARLRGAARPLLLVDCTASLALAEEYAGLVEAGVGVVTASKRAGCLPLPAYRRVRQGARASGVPLRWATAVGAGLPVLRAVDDLVKSGDRLLGMAALLSGTLSFVLHELQAGASLSAAVSEAARRGFTEPDPRQDLSGDDVARKLLLVLRQAGLEIEAADIAVEPLLACGDGPHDLAQALAAAEPEWRRRVEVAHAQDRRLAYVARFDGARARVGVEAVPGDHALARVRAGENVVIIETERYREVPLTLCGPGAGPELTAANLLADLLAGAAELRRQAPPPD